MCRYAGIGMVPVIAIPYWARVLRMPPVGVNTAGFVQLVTTPHGSDEAGEVVVLSGFRDPARVQYRDCADRLDKRSRARSRVRRQQEGARSLWRRCSSRRTTSRPSGACRWLEAPDLTRPVDNPLTAEPVVIVGYDVLAEPAGRRSGHRREDADAGWHPSCRGRHRAGAI